MADQYPPFLSAPPSPAYAAGMAAPLYPPAEAPQPKAPPAPPPQSALRNIWNGIAGGIVAGFPTMMGQAIQKLAPQGAPGSYADQVQKNAASAIEDAKTTRLSYPVDADSTWGQAAYGVGQFAPALAVAPALAAVGVPGVLAAGGSAAVGALLAGGSAAKEKEDEVLAAGGTPEMARTRGNQEGALQGAVQGIMAAIPGGRVLGGLGEKALQVAGKAVGKKLGAQTVLDSFASQSTT